ncbi:MAG: winged helix-turn-helix domain-containing protein [Pseudomonadota bacterium]
MAFLKIGAATVDPSIRLVCIGGKETRISPKAMSVLAALIDAKGAVVSRSALLERVWPDIFVGEEVLTQAIAELRRAFGDKPQLGKFIQTVPKTGYRLAADAAPFDRQTSPPNDVSIFLPQNFAVETENAIRSITAYYSAYQAFDRGGAAEVSKAVELCRESIDLDPTFAPAHALRSAALVYRELYYGKQADTLNEALQAAQSAITCDRAAPEGYAAQGFALAQLGEFDHAVTSFNAALRMRPDSYFVLISYGRALFARGAYAAASQLFDRAAQISSDEFHGLMLSASATRAAGDIERSAAKLSRSSWRSEKRLTESPEDLRALICRTYCEISSAGVESAALMLTELESNHDPLTYYIVGALARAGEVSLALDRLEAIVDNGWADPYFLRTDQDLNRLRNEPRFQKIENALAA